MHQFLRYIFKIYFIYKDLLGKKRHNYVRFWESIKLIFFTCLKFAYIFKASFFNIDFRLFLNIYFIEICFYF